jgi:signal transduction histidine kinase
MSLPAARGTCTDRTVLAPIALERARLVLPFLLIAMVWFTAFDDLVGAPLTPVSYVWSLGTIVVLAALWLLLSLRRLPGHTGHTVLAFVWLVTTCASAEQQFIDAQPALALVVLVEIVAVAVMLDTRIAIACVVLVDVTWLPALIVERRPGFEAYVGGAVAAQLLGLVLQIVFARAVRSAEQLRRAEVATAAALERQLEELASSQREREQLTDQLAASQRLEAAGTLAASLAHEVNNILTGITLTASILGRRAPRGRSSELDVIAAESERGAQLTRGLLALSRGGAGRREVQPFDEVVTRAAELIARTLPRTVRLEVAATAEVLVTCDAVQITQLLVNLALNGAEAMRDDGVLELETRVEQLAGADATRRGLSPGTFVRLEVRDHGIGMDAATRARAFDPFFTTKPLGNGTGLGLSTAWGIVRGHEGSIELDSTSGAGTTAIVHLPVTPLAQHLASAAVEVAHG